MKVLALNGSARKDWNTAKMLEAALDGAKSVGAEVKMVNLFDLNYKGCHGCSACKLLGGKFYGACAQQDDLTEILEEAKNADVLLLGSPMYFGDVTGMMRNFIERFLFPTLTYSKDMHRLYTKKVKVGLVYTYNAPAETYTQYMQGQCAIFNGMIGPCEYVFASETLQFTDYSKYDADMFDPKQRWDRHENVFPEDCKNAYEMGKRLAEMEI